MDDPSPILASGDTSALGTMPAMALLRDLARGVGIARGVLPWRGQRIAPRTEDPW
jgi:hypothetical protein